MAIVKMKKLRLMAVRDQKEKLLKDLMVFGCVELREPEENEFSPELSCRLSREDSGVSVYRAEKTKLQQAIDVLNSYVPKKSPLLSAKPDVALEEFLNRESLEKYQDAAERILKAEDRIRRIGAEESRIRSTAESLVPWLSFDCPLETEGTRDSVMTLGACPATASLDAVRQSLAESADEAELFAVSGDKLQHYLVLLCHRSQLRQALEALRAYSFSIMSFSGLSGTAQECTERCKSELKALAREKKELAAAIEAESEFRDGLKLWADRTETDIAFCEAEDKLMRTQSTVILDGWVPAEKLGELEKLLNKYDCAYELSDPTEEEYPEVPVVLKNNKLTNSMNMVTNMYSLPAYNGVDANPMMAPFFILIYGLMMADIGYGLIMVIAAVVAMKKIKPKAGTLAFCQLLLYAGISTMVMGALTGGCFGDMPYRVVHMINPASNWEGLPYLFSPVRDSNAVLYGSLVIGLIHLNTGMVISFVEKVKAGNLLDGIFEEGSLWVILIGGILWGSTMLFAGAPELLGKVGVIIVVIGSVMLLFGAGRHSKGFGKVTAAFGCIYNTLTGWFGDVLSYSRIMALMLAGGVVAQVFNTIAVMPAESSGLNLFTGLAFAVIFVIGHALNFGLNILGCFVHDLRLQCLEFFGKFYVDGGKPFSPLKVSSRYYDVKE